MLEHIKSTIDLIEDIGETHHNLLKNTFGILLSTPNTRFTQFFEHEKMLWEVGKTYDFDALDNIAKTVHNNMCTNKTQCIVDPKDAKILVLHAKIKEVKEELKKARSNGQKGTRSGATDYTIEQQCKVKGPDEIEKNGVTCWFCPRHKGSDYDGLHARHKPEDHDKVIARRRHDKKKCHGRNEEAKPTVEKDKQDKSQQKKLLLRKEMKAALLTISTFTEEQANAIANETQANLSKDFQKA